MVADVDTDLEYEGKVEGVLVDAALDVLEPPVHRVLLGGLLRRQPELGYLSQGLVAAKRVCKRERGSFIIITFLRPKNEKSQQFCSPPLYFNRC